jgi:hypothetical protein
VRLLDYLDKGGGRSRTRRTAADLPPGTCSWQAGGMVAGKGSSIPAGSDPDVLGRVLPLIEARPAAAQICVLHRGRHLSQVSDAVLAAVPA